MSMAACLADTNDLALDPATTAEDTQNTQQSIMSYTGSVFLLSACLTICLTASLLSISHAYLLPSLHLCHLSFLSPSSRLPKIQSFTPNTFFTSYRSIWASSRFRSSHNYSLCPSQSPFPCLPLSLSPIFHPPTPLVSLSPSLPSQQPYCPWVGVNNVSPHGAPVQSQPRRQGAPENTHNSMFQLGCRIKGSLTHG